MTEKRKLPRFHITPCQFHSTENKNYSIQDISLGGLSLRLLDRTELAAFAVGTEHKGLIKIEGAKVECAFKVKHLRGVMVGAEWVKPSADLMKRLEFMLDPKHLGETLKSYPVPDAPQLKWFHTPVGVDLLLYFSGETPSLNRWTLFFHQTFLQWEKDAGLKSGQSLAEDEEGYAHGIVRLETRLLEAAPSVDRRLLETARDFIAHAGALGSQTQTLMKHQIEGNL